MSSSKGNTILKGCLSVSGDSIFGADVTMENLYTKIITVKEGYITSSNETSSLIASRDYVSTQNDILRNTFNINITTLSNEIISNKTLIDSNKTLIDSKTNDINGLTNSVDSLTSLIDNMIIEIQANSNSSTSNFVTVNDNVFELSNNMVELTSNMVELSGSITQVSGSVDDLSGGMVELSASITQVSGSVDDLSGGMAELSGSITQVSGSVDDLSGGMAELFASITQVSGSVDDLSGGMAELSASITQVSGSVDDLSGNMLTLTNTMAELSGNMVELRNTTLEMSGNILELTNTTLELSGNMIEIVNTTAELSGNMVELTSNVIDISLNVTNLTEAISNNVVAGETMILNANNGIYWPINVGGGSGDTQYIKHTNLGGETNGIEIVSYDDTNDFVTIKTGSFNVEATGGFISNHEIEAPSFYATSDVRFKKNILPITSALDKVSMLQGVTYTYINSETPRIGLIAQEVEKVVPEVVRTSKGEEDYKSVEYGNLTSILIEAVKELRSQNELLQQEIASLKEAVFS